MRSSLTAFVPRFWFLRAVFALAGAVPGVGPLHAQAPATTAASQPAGAAIIVTVQGRVDFQRAGAGTWDRAGTNVVLRAHDRLRTGPRSRATLQLSNNSVQRVDELSSIEIGPADSQGKGEYQMELKEGGIYFFNREKPVEQKFKTPIASGAILGTEFALRVAPDGTTRVLLLEGEVDVAGSGGGGAGLRLGRGEEAIVEPGAAPRKTSRLDAVAAVQWCLYYPGVLHRPELGLTDTASAAIRDSIAAYDAGDLPGALQAYPADRTPADPAESAYLAGLVLAAGRVDEAERLLKDATGEAADAVRKLIAAVRGPAGEAAPATAAGTTAGASLAASYAAQASGDLEHARRLARRSVEVAPTFGLGWARLAELEFSFGDHRAAGRALDRALELGPRNAQAVALRGFVLAAQNRIDRAEAEFERAIALDGALANAWLGRGLARIRGGRLAEGRRDLQVAAATEPNRAVLRSYLGKAWQEERDFGHAGRELDRARELDPNDPTGWLYAALLSQRGNRINRSIDELEKARSLNDQRAVYRSRMLLDQDRAVRSANLASVYRDAGLAENSVQEAGRAVASDYANASAHQFLADSYDGLRDPRKFNLRYETPWFSELLTAQLLAPVGGGNLSQQVSQQEYSKLFERNRLGIMSSTEYWSHGDWQQLGSMYGIQGNTAFAFDTDYRSERGYGPNADLEFLSFYGRVKQQVGPSDSALLLLNINDYDFGDTRQLYDPTRTSPGIRVRERHEPNLFVGWHHQWAPGQDTLFLLGRLDASQRVSDTNTVIPLFTRARAGADYNGYQARPFETLVDRDIEIYNVELQHIATWNRVTAIGGARYQSGDIDYAAAQSPTGGRSGFPPIDIFKPGSQAFDEGFQRATVYAYGLWRPLDPVALTLGGDFDHVRFPASADLAPLAPGRETVERFLPKAGLTWDLTPVTHLRAAWSRSLGGVSYDSSIRLEPVQIAGFNQAFRSIIPESVAGLISGADMEMLGAGLEHQFPTRTTVIAAVEQLTSDGDQTFGGFEWIRGTLESAPAQFRRNLDFKERAASLAVNQRAGKHWIFALGYRIADAELDVTAPQYPAAVRGSLESHPSATLHELVGSVAMNVECGFFWQGEARWNYQQNRHAGAGVVDEDFWQFNLFAGYRFLQRRLEVRVGLLNLTDQDYRLSPLNVHLEHPRERMLYAGLKFHF